MFADRLKYEREKKGLSQVDLADRLGISKQTVYKYEKGIAIPSVDTLLDIANIFDCSMDYLFGRTDNRGIAIVEVEHEGKIAKVGVPREQANRIDEIENEVHKLLNEIKKIKQ